MGAPKRAAALPVNSEAAELSAQTAAGASAHRAAGPGVQVPAAEYLRPVDLDGPDGNAPTELPPPHLLEAIASHAPTEPPVDEQDPHRLFDSTPAESGMRPIAQARRNSWLELEGPASLSPSDLAQVREEERRADEVRSKSLLGQLVAGYRVGECLGEGGTSLVFAAERESDGEAVVIKAVRSLFVNSAIVLRSLEREASVARSVLHPGVVGLRGRGELADGSPYLVMERVFGRGLGKLMPQMGMVGIREAVAVVLRVAEILRDVHRAGFVHRDVKPEHIMIAETSASTLEVHLLDFGACVRMGEREDSTDGAGYVVGTPNYMSPEQASGEVGIDGRSDVYSLGVVLYQLLCGRTPFGGPNLLATLVRVMNEDPPRLALVAPRVGLKLDEVVARALCRNPAQRYASAEDFIRALLPFAGDRIVAEKRFAELMRGAKESIAPKAPPGE